jgi:hypothetical protein
MSDEAYLNALQTTAESFIARAREEFEERLRRWPLDLTKNEIHEVVGALLARQLTLALELANSPTIWNGHVAPLVLRAMADVHIAMTWVLLDPGDRSRQFIHYGLGQEKLILEHRRADLETREAREGELEYLSAMEEWINRQRATFLTDINLGSWSGLSTRTMAEEAGCTDFYSYVYTPFSACTHSMWHHVAKYNLKECTNPLHRFHSIPHVADLHFDPHYLYLAAKYLQKTFAAFDRAIGTRPESQSAFDLLCSELDALNQSQQSNGTSSATVNSNPE